MILHTIMPVEEVMQGFEEAQQQHTKRHLDIDVGGVKMQVEVMSPGYGHIIRIMSTDPNHYLRPELQPGSLVRWLGE